MPSEQRLHPATLLFDLAKHVKNFAVPALFVIFGASRSSSGPGGQSRGIPDGWEAWLMVLFVPAAIASIVRYVTFRLRYDGDELVIRSGLLFRNERHIPFSRIQNVDATQNLFHRLFNVVEVRVETGGGKEEEARLNVLPKAAFEEMRRRVFAQRARAVAVAPDAPDAPNPQAPSHSGTPAPEELVHLSLRELLLCGFLENKGMVLIGAAYGLMWEAGLGRIFDPLVGSTVSRGFFRDLFRAIGGDGPLPIVQLAVLVAGIPVLLILVRVISMIWALVRLYDFRLVRIGEDLRSEYGLFTKVTATVPIRRVQAITISAGPLHRWLKRASVRVATAGGAGTKQQSSNVREWLAPLIREDALPNLLQHIVPGFDLSTVDWQPLHPRAFRRAIKPSLVFTAIVTLGAWFLIGRGAIAVLFVLLPWTIISTQKYVTHLKWADGEEVVAMRSGWLWQQTTLARVNKIQAVAMHQTPFDRRAAMARVRVDTAGAGDFSHRVDIPYLDQQIARALSARLSAAAANTAFRW
ncbi:MAG TPA: PH domain-containing protein [Vicinamibacterales bacterium]|nr:PH domain-containing protein [Vicinamibacterales bacterium]